MSTSTAAAHRKRLLALIVLGVVAVGSAIGLTTSLVSWSSDKSTQNGRALSAEEAQRLATMRLTNFREGRSGLRATIGPTQTQTRLAGWVDWRRRLVYLAVSGADGGQRVGLLQATPGVLASRPDSEPKRAAGPVRTPSGALGDGAAPQAVPLDLPPVTPPADGWRVRRLVTGGPRPAALDSFLHLLFAISADRPDAVEPLRGGAVRWLGQAQVSGTPVDVLLAPVGPTRPPGTGPGTAEVGPASGGSGPASAASAPTAEVARAAVAPAAPAPHSPAASKNPVGSHVPPATAAIKGSVRYWLNGVGQLRRLETLLAGNVPLRLDLDRAAGPGVTAIDALGGRAVRPRAITIDEADLLADLSRANRARGGARITLSVPTVQAGGEPGAPANLRGAGWVDWVNGIAYLAVRDLDEPTGGTLLRADGRGVATRDAPRPVATSRKPTRAAEVDPPPLPPPNDHDWGYGDWRGRTDALGALDLDLLINEALASGATDRGEDATSEDAARLRGHAAWLRQDSVAGRKVTVFEIPKAAETGTPRGQARLRYWVDGAGVLRRLELRTRTGAFAQLDLAPGPAPYVAPVPIA